MESYRLSKAELSRLKALHRQTREKRFADRIKAVILLGSGWSVGAVAEALLIDRNTVREYYKLYQSGGKDQLITMNYRGSQGYLTDEQLDELDTHLQETLYQTVKEVRHYVHTRWDAVYTDSGMTALLHELGYVYKKPKLVPGKANAEAQEVFLEEYEKLKKNKGKDDSIYFMDATHPQHNPVLAYGWIKRGIDHELPSNTGRKRVNINGVINLSDMQPIVRFDDTINAASTIALFQQIEEVNDKAGKIHIICDNARYYRSKAVSQYLTTSRIELIFLPPYAPNLNLIERYWKFFKKKLLYNSYFETFDEFRSACEDFFKNSKSHVSELCSLLTENFQILGA